MERGAVKSGVQPQKTKSTASLPGTVLLRAAEPISCVSFSPFDGSLLAYGIGSRVTLASFASEPLGLTELCNFHHGCPVTRLAWSPVSNHQQLVVATAGTDNKVRCVNPVHHC